MQEELVSIIVPVYNAQTYLSKCVDTLIAQTYKNCEIILINDGSQDGSGLICDGYANKFENVKVIHKENEGVSRARNLGLSVATGEWIAFVDSDDYVTSDYVTKMIQNQRKYGSDWVISGYTECFEKKSFSNTNIWNVDYIAFEQLGQFVYYWHRNVHVSTPWGKLFRASIIRSNNIMFENSISYGEDHIFNIRYMEHCKSISVVCDALYTYVKRKGSLTSDAIDRKMEYDLICENFTQMCLKCGYDEKSALLLYARYVRGRLYTVKMADFATVCNEIQSDERFIKANSYLNDLDQFTRLIFSLLLKRRTFMLRIVIWCKKFANKHMTTLFHYIRGAW